MSSPGNEDLQAIAERVFMRQETKLAEEAEAYNQEQLVAGARGVRRIIHSTARDLPDSAFQAQPDDAEGNPVWSAGQVASHVSGSVIWINSNVRELLQLEAAEPATDLKEFSGEKPLAREESLQALEIGNREFEKVVAAIPGDADLSRTAEHEALGPMNVKSWFLLDALHAMDHVDQLKDLK